MNNIDYLLKYISNSDLKKILSMYDDYKIEVLSNNRVDVDLNIRFLIKYGVSNTGDIVIHLLDDLVMPHNEFINKINDYEKKMSKSDVIIMLENL